MSEPENVNAEPFQELGTSRPEVRHQGWCSADVPAGADRCPSCHVFQPSNVAALKTGLYSQQLLDRTPQRALMAARRAAVVVDLGGDPELTEIARGEVERFARLSFLLDILWEDLLTGGVLTAKGRRRAALSAYLSVNDRLDRVVGRLGLRRTPKPVPTLTEALAAIEEQEANG